MADNDNEICSICEQHPEDILMLECTHDLCVSCAAEIYGKANKKSAMFTCEICLAQTTLDRDSIQCLENALQHMKGKTRESRQHNIPVATISNSIAQLPPAPPKSRPSQGLCMEHKQQLLYYCFDCRTGEICAECILTERHRGHQVSTFKKAIGQIVKHIENDIREKELVKNKILNEKKKLIEGQVLLRSHVESRRKELKTFFDEIHNLVTNHYQRLTHELEDMAQASEVTMRGQLDLTESKITDINQDIEKLQQTLKQSDKMLIIKYSRKPIQTDSRYQEWKLDPVVSYVTIEYPQMDVVDELTRLLQRMSIHVDRGFSTSGYSNRARTEGISPIVQHKVETQKPPTTDNKRMHRRQIETTPVKPELKHSLDLASNIISKLQTRQKKFE